jgi:gas vesicle protein
MSITSNDPDEIRRQIDETRADLSANVDALGESVRPGNVARRQVDKVKGGITDIKDKVMGEADSAGSSVAGSVGSAKDAVASAPATATRKTRGNPWAAGLIAFGAGALLSSLLPATEVEKEAAATIKDKAEPLTDQAKEAARDLAQSVKEPAQQAVQQVKDRATDAADTVKDEARENASDVASSSKEAAQQVREQNA